MKNLSDMLSDASAEDIKHPPRGKARNKTSGHGFERWGVKWWQRVGFPHVQTSRQESRSRDNSQIDLTNEDEHIHGRLPYNVQMKCYSENPDYNTIFHGGHKWTKATKNNPSTGVKKGDKIKRKIKPMPTIEGIINVVFHKSVRKDPITGIFNPANIETEDSTYVTMKLSDFEIIVKERLELEILRRFANKVKEECNKE